MNFCANQTFAVPKKYTMGEKTGWGLVSDVWGCWQMWKCWNVCSCPCIDPRAGSQQENNKHLLCQCLLSPAVGQATLQSQPQQQNIYGHSWKEWIIISQPCCSIYKPFCRRCSENGERCCCKAAVKSHLQLELLRIFTWQFCSRSGLLCTLSAALSLQHELYSARFPGKLPRK